MPAPDLKIFYRKPVMDLIGDDLTRVTDRGEFIWFEGVNQDAVFRINEAKLDYYVNGEKLITYDCGRMFLIFAIRRGLIDNFFS